MQWRRVTSAKSVVTCLAELGRVGARDVAISSNGLLLIELIVINIMLLQIVSDSHTMSQSISWWDNCSS